MNLIKGLRLSSKLILSFIIIALVSIVVGVVGILGMNTLSKADEEMYLYNAKSMGAIAIMYDLFATQRINVANMVIFFQSDPEFSQAELESLTEKEQAFDIAFNDFRNWISNEEENTIYENLKQLYYNDFSLCKRNVKDAVLAGDETAMEAAMQAIDSTGSEVSDFLDELNVLNERLGLNKVNANKALSWSRTITLIIVMTGGTVLSLILAFSISSLVAKPLTAATRMLSHATKSIENSARELTSSAVSLAESSNEQAASIEEVSATMNQTASMIRQNADNTLNAKELATTAGKMIAEAITRADEMKKCMIELSTSSEKITKIVSDISSISFQTNILSLNASVEASRAGEAGRSFIVVAEEVRSLAQRSAESAKNTGSIINSNSVLTKESGISSEMVNKSLSEADENAKKVFELLNEISLASEEQSRGVQQVNITMAEIEKSMQSSAASSEESAAAANMLESLIDDLNGVFESLELVVYGNSSHSGHQ